nr:MAG TPA: hypothetical protein [Caudoviricetes sp.]
MKQVTMESVKQRIADLESAGKVVGGLSLSSEFELACLRELVAVTEQVRLLTEQRDAVVALNTAAKKVIKMNRQHAKDQHGNADIAESWSCVKVLREALKNPDTDAAIAALRAEALPTNIAEIIDSGDLETICWHSEHASSEDFRLALYNFRQLRESKGEVQS